MSDAIAKLLFAIAALAIAFGAVRWYGHTQREAGRQEVIATAQKAASAAEAKNATTSHARDDLAAAAVFRFLERQKQQEAERAEELARRADDQRLIARLRNTAVAGDRRAPDDARDTCSAEHQRRDAEIDRLLAEGQRLGIEAAELAAEARGLVNEGARGLAESASLIELANEWGRAVKLGERP